MRARARSVLRLVKVQAERRYGRAFLAAWGLAEHVRSQLLTSSYVAVARRV